SPLFRHFLTPDQVSDRFGPSRHAYEAVLHYLRSNGFSLVDGSANRLTLTVRGRRAQGERAFGVHIKDFAERGRRFFANDTEPAVPSALASKIGAVTGLTNLSVPRPAQQVGYLQTIAETFDFAEIKELYLIAKAAGGVVVLNTTDYGLLYLQDRALLFALEWSFIRTLPRAIAVDWSNPARAS